MLFLSLKWLCKGTKMSCSASGSTFACFDKSEASMLYVRRFKTVGKQSSNGRFWQESAPCQKWRSRISILGQILLWCLHSKREVMWGGWWQAPRERCAFGGGVARSICPVPSGCFCIVCNTHGCGRPGPPQQQLAETLTPVCGCQLAGGKDKAQLCLSQNQLSFAKDRCRLTSESSSLGLAFACFFWQEAKVAQRYEGTFVLCVSPSKHYLCCVVKGS